MAIALELPGSVKSLNPVPVDWSYGPFANVAAAKAAIPLGLRYDGLTVQITGSGNYWWLQADLTDPGLVVKSGGISLINGSGLTFSTDHYNLGGTLTLDATLTGSKLITLNNGSAAGGGTLLINANYTSGGLGVLAADGRIASIGGNLTASQSSANPTAHLSFSGTTTFGANNAQHNVINIGSSYVALNGGFTGTTLVGLYYNPSSVTAAKHYSMILASGLVGIGSTTPTATLHLGAGIATNGPFKLTIGTNVTTITGAAQDGLMEYDGTHLSFIIGSTRYQLDQQGGAGWPLNGTGLFTGAVLIDETTTGGNTLKFKTPGLGVTPVDGKGIWIYNDSVAVLNNQQISGSLVLEGSGFATTPVAPQSVKWRIDNLPVQGAANPTTQLRFASSVNAGAYITQAHFLSDGSLNFPNSASSILFAAGNGLIQTGGGGNMRLGASGAGGGVVLEAAATSVNGSVAVTIGGGAMTQTTGSSQMMLFRSSNTFAPASGTATYSGISFNHVLNTTGSYGGIGYGIDYNPTLTSVTGLTHIAFRATSGSILIGGTTITAGSVLMDLQSTTLALLLSRVTNIASVATPVNGMIVYDAATNLFNDYENGIWIRRRRTLFSHFADAASTTSTSEVSLYDDTLAANTLQTNGEGLVIDYTITIKNTGATGKDIKLKIGGVVVYDTGTQNPVSTTTYHLHIYLIRESSTTLRATVDWDGLTNGARYTSVTGLTLSNANHIILSTTNTGTPVAGDVTVVAGLIEYVPSP